LFVKAFPETFVGDLVEVSCCWWRNGLTWTLSYIC